MSTGLTVTRGTQHFGTVAVAMVTPFDADGALNVEAGRKLAAKLVDEGCDALVLGGTTGESPTTSDEEKLRLLSEVRAEVGDSCKLIAGTGSYNTEHSCQLSRRAAQAGADGLLIVTPYYSKPSQAGLVEHFRAVAQASDVPICLYDIPGRSAVGLAPDTIRRLAELPTIMAMKDATGLLGRAPELIADTELAWYSGDDPLNLPWLSLGASGFISVIGHVAAGRLRQLYDAFAAGQMEQARQINASLSPLHHAQAMLGGVSFAKAALNLMGLNVGNPRLPQMPPCGDEQERLRAYLHQFGVLIHE